MILYIYIHFRKDVMIGLFDYTHTHTHTHTHTSEKIVMVGFTVLDISPL